MAWWKIVSNYKRNVIPARTAGLGSRRPRLHRFEPMEPRLLFAVDGLHIGLTYLENDSGSDSSGDTFEILFEGGAPGTQLRQVIINTDRGPEGLGGGDLIFDTVEGGLGADHAFGMQIVGQAGIDSVTWDVVDGGTLLVLNFTGFDAGEKLIFQIDVDEVQEFDPEETNLQRINEGIDPVTSGVEFQGSRLTATFAAPRYFDVTGSGQFRNQYDPLFSGTTLLRSSGNTNGLSHDDFEGKRDRSTGVQVGLAQQPLPAQIEGYVYHDANNNGIYDSNEAPISGVTVALVDANGKLHQSAATDAAGFYRFGGLASGKYTLIETQPAGWLDGLDSPGTIDGRRVGNAANDRLTDIVLQPDDSAIEYNFGELLPGSIAGKVFVDENGDCLFDTNENPLAGVQVELLDASGSILATTTTNAAGEYLFQNLVPGEYAVRETQPTGYLQGGQRLGSHGGDATTPDLLTALNVSSGAALVEYNFCEIVVPIPASLAGEVFIDLNNDAVRDPNEGAIAGVVIVLLDEQGQRVARTITDAAGQYRFDNLAPGVYRVREGQPEGYFQGSTISGSHGGIAQTDLIRQVKLEAGDNATHYDFAEIPPARISGTVFRDGDAIVTEDGLVPSNLAEIRDGQLTDDDQRLAGVVLELRNSLDGMPIMGDETLPGSNPDGPLRVTTDANGNYSFLGLRPGNYAVVEIHPEGYVDGIDSAGTNGGIAINPDAEDVPPLQQFSNLGVDLKNDAIVRIPLGAGQHAQQNNFSEVELTTKPGYIPPVVPPPVDPLQIQPPPPFVPNLPALPLLLAPLVQQPEELITGSDSAGFTWHLSVTDGGAPRAADYSTRHGETKVRAANWQDQPLEEDLRSEEWELVTTSGKRRLRYGHPEAIAFVGDYDGDGSDEIGLYLNGTWFIDKNGNGEIDAEDLHARLGTKQDRPVVGDWNGDGKDDIGIFGPEWQGDRRHMEHEPGLPDVANKRRHKPKNLPPIPAEATIGGRELLNSTENQQRIDLIDHVFEFGIGSDVPVAGDWNGDGISTPGVNRNGEWKFDQDGDGQFSEGDLKAQFGEPGWRPVVGDWNGDGRDQIGVFRAGEWILDTNGNRMLDEDDTRVTLGKAGDRPIAGDFDGDGVDEPAVIAPLRATEAGSMTSAPASESIPAASTAGGTADSGSSGGSAAA